MDYKEVPEIAEEQVKTRKLTNNLGWTVENKPSRETLVECIRIVKEESQALDLYEDDKYLNAVAMLEVWDDDFGPPKEYIVNGTDDPKILEAAQKKQAWLEANIKPIPSVREQLATLKPVNPQDVIDELLRKYRDGQEKADNSPIKDFKHPYEIIPVEYIFDTLPETKEAMGQLRKRKVDSNIVDYESKYLPVSYLVVSYNPQQFMEAVNLMKGDLELLGNSGAIIGHMSMPKVMKLGECKHALYVWPFVDYYKLASNLGKDFAVDFKYNEIELLESIGLKMVSEEGSLGKLTLNELNK